MNLLLVCFACGWVVLLFKHVLHCPLNIADVVYLTWVVSKGQMKPSECCVVLIVFSVQISTASDHIGLRLHVLCEILFLFNWENELIRFYR